MKLSFFDYLSLLLMGSIFIYAMGKEFGFFANL